MIEEEVIEGLRSKADDYTPPPVTATHLAKAESKLGFSLPPLLRRVYLEVADGHVAELGQLTENVETYLELVAREETDDEPRWPEKLIPIAHFYVESSFLDVSELDGKVFFQVDGEPEDVGHPLCLVEQRPNLRAFLEDWVEGRDLERGFRRTNFPEPGSPEIEARRIEFAATGWISEVDLWKPFKIVRRALAEHGHRNVFDQKRDRGNPIDWQLPVVRQNANGWKWGKEVFSGFVDLPQNTRDAPILTACHWAAWLSRIRLEFDSEFSGESVRPLEWSVSLDGQDVAWDDPGFQIESILPISDDVRDSTASAKPISAILSEISCCSHFTIYANKSASCKLISRMTEFLTAIEEFAYSSDRILAAASDLEEFKEFQENPEKEMDDYERKEFGLAADDDITEARFNFTEQVARRDTTVCPLRFSRLESFESKPFARFSIYCPNAPMFASFLNQLPPAIGDEDDREIDRPAISKLLRELLRPKLKPAIDLGLDEEEINEVIEQCLAPHGCAVARYFLDCQLHTAEVDVCPDH